MSLSNEKILVIEERFSIREYNWARWALLKDRSEDFQLLSGFRDSRAKAILNLAKKGSKQEYDLLIMASLKECYKEILSKMEELVNASEQKKIEEIELETKKIQHELYLESIKPERMAQDRKIKKADMVNLFKKPLLERCRTFFGEKEKRFDPGEIFFERAIAEWMVRTDLTLSHYDSDFLCFDISYKKDLQIKYIFRYEYALSVASEWPGSLYPEDVPALIERTMYLIKRFNEIDAPEILKEFSFDC